MNTQETLEIYYSPTKIALATVAMCIMAVVCWQIAFHGFSNVKPGSFQEFVGYMGIVICPIAAIFGGWRLFTILRSPETPVVTLTAVGIRDIRIAKEEIPWQAIWEIGTVKIKNQKILVLSIDPAIEAQLSLTAGALRDRRWGVDGLCITAQGLKISHRSLASLIENHVRHAHGLVTA